MLGRRAHAVLGRPARLAAVYDGTLYRGTDSWGMDWALVVTGPPRGYVWQLSKAGITPCQRQAALSCRQRYFCAFSSLSRLSSASTMPGYWSSKVVRKVGGQL